MTDGSNRKQKNSKRLFDAIKVIEEAGLSVYGEDVRRKIL